MTLRVAWLAYGTLEQPTGGYIYDRIIVEQLRAQGASVELCPLVPNDSSSAAVTRARLIEGASKVVVGDALCVDELGPLFESLAGHLRRVLLVHHLTSWELGAGAKPLASLRALESRAVASADRIITTSQTTARRLGAEYPGYVPHCVEPGADRLRRLPRALEPTEHRLLGVGSLIARKRWELLLTALDELSAPNLHLRLVGDDSRDLACSHSLAMQIARSPYLATHVKCMGVIEDEQLAEELAEADALVLPSSLEGYGMVLTEALHAGVPVMASRAGAVPKVLTDSDAALLFDEDSELLVLLNRFVREPQLRTALQRAATACAPALPTWASAGARFHGLLTQSH